MREIFTLEHRLIGESEFRQLEFVKGSTNYEYKSKNSNQGRTWEFTVEAIIKNVDIDLLQKLCSASVLRITGVEEILEIGREDIPIRAEVMVNEQTTIKVKLIDIRLNRRLR